MDRKKTILVAVMINASLLVVLFVTALVSQDDVVSEQIVGNTVSQPLFSSSADLALQQPSSSSPSVPTKVMFQPPVQETPKFSEPTSIHKTEVPVVHKLPPLNEGAVASSPPLLSSSPKGNPSFSEFVVKKGDSLDKIAKANQTTVEEIVKLNGLPGSFLKVGQVLKLPQPQKGALAVSQKPSNEVALAGEANYYVVKVGDNPWGIAMKNHLKVEELLKLNNLNEERARKLKPGDRLRIR